MTFDVSDEKFWAELATQLERKPPTRNPLMQP